MLMVGVAVLVVVARVGIAGFHVYEFEVWVVGFRAWRVLCGRSDIANSLIKILTLTPILPLK